MDRGQRIELVAAAGAKSHQELAHARVDSNGTPGHATRCRQRRDAVLFRASRLDNRTGDLRRRRRLIDESRGPARNTARVAGPKERSSVRNERPVTRVTLRLRKMRSVMNAVRIVAVT